VKKTLAIAVGVLLLAFILPANAASKLNSSCSKVGNTARISTMNLICSKDGKKLIWQQNIWSTSSSWNNASNLTTYRSQTDLCKIKDLRTGTNIGLGAGSVGFPLKFNRIKPNGTVKVAVLPVNFPDSPKVDSPNSYLNKYISLLDNRNKYLYRDRIKYEWTVLTDWLMMDKSAVYFAWDHPTVQSDGSRKSDGVNQILSTQEQASLIFSEAEKKINLKDFDFFWIFTNPVEDRVPQGPEGDFRMDITTKQSGKLNLNFYPLGNRLYSGKWGNWGIKGSTLEDTLAHEMAHFHGMIQHAPGNGWGWYISNNPTWETWLTGWRPDSEYFCLDKAENWKSVNVNLSSIDLNSTGYKSAVIRLSDSQVLVVESRRKGPFTTALPESFSGITVYLVDTTKSGERWDGNFDKEYDYYMAFLRIKGKLKPVPKFNNLAVWDENIYAKQGEKFEFGDIRIELTKSGDFDSITISKLN